MLLLLWRFPENTARVSASSLCLLVLFLMPPFSHLLSPEKDDLSDEPIVGNHHRHWPEEGFQVVRKLEAIGEEDKRGGRFEPSRVGRTYADGRDSAHFISDRLRTRSAALLNATLPPKYDQR